MQPAQSALHEQYQHEPYHDAGSAYSLATVPDIPSPTQRTALLHSPSSSSTQSYGTTLPARPSSRRVLVIATLKMATIFVLSTAFLGTTLWLALPTLDEYAVIALKNAHTYSRVSVFREDRPHLKLPKSFVELQALNGLLKKYRDIYPYRIVICYVTTYLLLVFPTNKLSISLFTIGLVCRRSHSPALCICPSWAVRSGAFQERFRSPAPV
jgi:hypothetical protein